MRNQPDGGEAILEALRTLDVDYIISSPGSDWGALWEALARQKVSGTRGPTYISCGHETLATDMALGYTFLTGRMQAVVLHAGVGLLQGSIAIDAAKRLNLPMLVFSSEALSYGEQPGFDPGFQWTSYLNVVGGPQRLVEPIVKFATPAMHSATLFETIVRAGEMAQRTPAGPVYVNVPIETMLQGWTPPRFPRKTPRPATPRAPEEAIARVAKLLAAAEVPVIITEAMGREPEGYRALFELAEALAIPVIENPTAEVTNFSKDHPLHQGFTLQPLHDAADLVLVARSRVPWYPPGNRPPRAKIVVIDENPVRDNMVYQNVPADIYLEGDAVHTLCQLLAGARAAKPDAAKIKERQQRCAAAHDKLFGDYRQKEREGEGKPAITAALALRKLGEILPGDALYCDETITYRPAVLGHLPVHGPQSLYRIGGGLGQGLGAALGLKLAAPERFVALVLGDGAFLYNPMAQSLALAKHANLPILVFILNNTGYRSMMKEHRNYYPDGVAAANELFYGQMITDFDYAELAKPFGGFGRKIARPAELEPAIKEAVEAVKGGRLAVLNVLVE